MRGATALAHLAAGAARAELLPRRLEAGPAVMRVEAAEIASVEVADGDGATPHPVLDHLAGRRLCDGAAP